MKRSSIIILVTMLMSMVVSTASAHDIEVKNKDGVTIYYCWQEDDENEETVLVVTCRGDSFDSYENEYSGEVIIPSQVSYNGKTYKVTEIGSRAFLGCSDLTSVIIPNSVTWIGEWAFEDCSSLTSVIIPNSVKRIENGAFVDCSSLTSITFPNSVISFNLWVFDGTPWYDNQPDGLVYAGKVAYKYKGEIPANTHITIKDGTLAINESVFIFCENREDLVSITIPSSVTIIGGSAFSGCSGLTSVTIPNSVESIGWGAFSGCSGLTSISIPNSVEFIDFDAFEGCSKLASIRVESGNAFYDSRNNCRELYTCWQ